MRCCLPQILLLLLAAGCGGGGTALSVDAAAPAADVAADVAANPFTKLDVLFMMDNSAGMVELRADLPVILPSFLDELRKLPGGLPDVHVGVITSDLGVGVKPLANGGCPTPGGDRGVLQTKPTCGLDPGARFIDSAANGTMNNFTGSMEKAFTCIAQVGIAGCGYEHQLEAIRVALDENLTTENKGFLRPDAVLAIIMFTDEDDCSADPLTDLYTDDASFPNTTASFRCAQVGHLCNGMTPPIAPFDVPLASCQANPGGPLIAVNDIVASIRARKARPDQQILVAGFFGWPLEPQGARYRYVQANQGVDIAPACSSGRGETSVGLRLKSFVESFGVAGLFTSICEPDFRPTLQRFGQAVATRF
jgi:hypothetical protein